MRVSGRVELQGDKSISHRALILGTLACGRSRVCGILDSADIRSTAGVLRSLGASVPPLAGVMDIHGAGWKVLRSPAHALECGNSGTTARLMAGVVAGLPITARFTGDESLSRRPMRRIARPLEAMGARVVLENGGDHLPMRVAGGSLRSIEWTTEAASAQIKSAILLAGLVAGVPVSITEPAPSRDHTERMLGARGVTIGTGANHAVRLDPVRELAPADMSVPRDPSSAAAFVALAMLADEGEIELPGVCVNPGRTGFMAAARRMGANVNWESPADQGDARRTGGSGGEPVATVLASATGGADLLHGITVCAADVPAMIDELPLLACVAARARGETVLHGAHELRLKESNRIAAVVSNLRAIGVDADELADGFRIIGTRAPLRGRVITYGDHRLAMSFGVLGASRDCDIVVDDRECVAVSYPRFWEDLARVTG
ncbi:MAG: 3-phosphoshikimate 1-carboxyvinyltransferase [Gemmatimonadaceae bacterium]